MDIEKLKSIIRLANNNPNENEANLAARKACKILAENEFSLLKTNRTAADKLNQHASNYGTWGGFNRSTEPNFRSKPPDRPKPEQSNYSKGPFSDNPYDRDNFWNEFWKNAQKNPTYDPIYDETMDADSYDGGKTWKSRRQAAYEARNINYQWNGEPKKKKEARDRVCSECGLKVSTYRHREEPFVCSVCQWKDKL